MSRRSTVALPSELARSGPLAKSFTNVHVHAQWMDGKPNLVTVKSILQRTINSFKELVVSMTGSAGAIAKG